jgi:copper resistance protein C
VAAAPTATVAHSILLDAAPAAGAHVSAPRQVALRFNNRVEKALCALQLVAPGGETRPLAITADGAVDRLAAPLPALAPGVYRLEWRVLSTDGHVVSGGYSFTVTP